MTDRLIIDAYGVDDEAVQIGVGWLVDYANEHHLSSAGLIISRIGDAENLHAPLGGVGQRLSKNREAQRDGVTIHLLTPRGGLGPVGGGPILAVWADRAMMEEVERTHPPAVCAIPWGDDLRVWKQAWAPADLRLGTSAGPAPQIVDPLVRLAIEGLTVRVSLSQSLSHPSDKQAAGTTIKTLIYARAPVDSSEIEPWTIANGWPLHSAREFAEMTSKLLAGQQVRAGKVDPELLARWQARLAE